MIFISYFLSINMCLIKFSYPSQSNSILGWHIVNFKQGFSYVQIDGIIIVGLIHNQAIKYIFLFQMTTGQTFKLTICAHTSIFNDCSFYQIYI